MSDDMLEENGGNHERPVAINDTPGMVSARSMFT